MKTKQQVKKSKFLFLAGKRHRSASLPQLVLKTSCGKTSIQSGGGAAIFVAVLI